MGACACAACALPEDTGAPAPARLRGVRGRRTTTATTTRTHLTRAGIAKARVAALACVAACTAARTAAIADPALKEVLAAKAAHPAAVKAAADGGVGVPRGNALAGISPDPTIGEHTQGRRRLRRKLIWALEVAGVRGAHADGVGLPWGNGDGVLPGQRTAACTIGASRATSPDADHRDLIDIGRRDPAVGAWHGERLLADHERRWQGGFAIAIRKADCAGCDAEKIAHGGLGKADLGAGGAPEFEIDVGERDGAGTGKGHLSAPPAARSGLRAP